MHSTGTSGVSHAGREKGLFLLISTRAAVASAVSSLLFDPWNPSVTPTRVPSTSPSRKARQQMMQSPGKCIANPHLSLQPKAEKALSAAQPLSAGVEIHGLILSYKGRKTFLCECPPGRDGFIFGFAEHISAARSKCVLLLHRQWAGDVVGGSPMVRDGAPGIWRLGPCFKTPLIALETTSKAVWYLLALFCTPRTICVTCIGFQECFLGGGFLHWKDGERSLWNLL